LIDTPPLNRGLAQPELMDLIRRSDLILLVVDLSTDPIEQLEDSVSCLVEHRIVPERLREQHTGQRRVTVIPVLVLANKNDDDSTDEDFAVLNELVGDDWSLLPVSGRTGRHLESLKQTVFKRLEIIRVYSKPPGEPADLSVPFAMRAGNSVEEFAAQVHQDFYDRLKSARVWGTGVHPGQVVSRDHILHDGDVVELRI
jgi:ribosome-interacting GTPase 1